MENVEFLYQGSSTIIQCKGEEKMENILQKFRTKLELDKDSTYEELIEDLNIYKK